MDVPIQLDGKARAILLANSRGCYTVPTAGLYPYQWNWDSAFAACGFASFDMDRAWTELETLLAAQRPSGMVPHIVFHEDDDGYFPGPEAWGTDGGEPASSGITQPPVVATIARKLLEIDLRTGRHRMGAIYPWLLAWHRWFHEFRCESGAVAATHPWETGRDNAPDWDTALARIDVSRKQPFTRKDLQHVDKDMRPTDNDYDRYIELVHFGRKVGWDERRIEIESPFRVADPTLTFTLLRANRDLRAIAGHLKKPTSEIDYWIRNLQDGAAILWNPELESYDSFDLRSRSHSGSLSSASFLCWYAGLDNATMVSKLQQVLRRARYGVPSYSPDGENFEPRRYWRGPVWAIMNMMIGMGLEEFGYDDLAMRIRSDVRTLISSGGFAEYFDPHDGTPAGGQCFTWTAAVWLAWASPTRTGGNHGITET